MRHLSMQSNAKVNLSLDVLGLENDKKNPFAGYHHIQTILHEITPENTHDFRPDIIFVKVSDAKKKSTIKLPEGFTSFDNTLFKAANLILKKYCKNSLKNIEIGIEKNIPIASGLGGGASNGATVLKALNELLTLNLSVKELQSLAAQIGMDAPFFIRGGVALGENFGELITQLPEVKGLAFTLILPDVNSSQSLPSTSSSSENLPKNTFPQSKTTSSYASLDLTKCGKQTEKSITLLRAIKTNDAFAIHENIHNDFETLLGHPLPKNHHLAGAGPTQFILV